jgi:hypothetical protein
MTAIDNDVILAILAMGAYDQGTDVGLGDVGAQIGDATWLRDSSTVLDEGAGLSAGFYADEYSLSGKMGAQTVISYRGTNHNNFVNPFGAAASVLLHGCPLALGYLGSSRRPTDSH